MNENTLSQPKVLLSGAGTAGPVLSLTLKRARRIPVLFDSAPSFGYSIVEKTYHKRAMKIFCVQNS